MAKKKVKFYLTADKDRNRDLVKTLDFPPGTQAERNFTSALETVELHAEVETNDGSVRILNILTEDLL